MNPYFTDEVAIVTVTHDVNGAETATTGAAIPARVSEKHRRVTNQKGEEVVGSMQVLVASDVVVDYDSRVVIKKIGGVTYPLPTKEWSIVSLSHGHGLGALQNLIEAWV